MENIMPTLSLSEAISSSTSKIFQIEGRARRSEYWWTRALVWVITILIAPIGWVCDLLTIPLTIRRLHDTGRSGWWWGVGALMKFAFFVCFAYDVVMAVSNSMNISGCEDQLVMAFLLKYGVFTLVVFLYQLLLLVFLCLDSEDMENEYGDSPKYVQEEDCEEVE